MRRSLHLPEDALIRDGFPAPPLEEHSTLSMPYCDNIRSLSLDQGECNQGKDRIVGELSRLGFSIHEEEDASFYFHTLGGFIDGDKGEVRMTQQRAWNLIQAFEHIAVNPTSPDTVQRLLGQAMFFSTLNRSGMSVFRKLYDFVEKGGSTRHLPRGEARECHILQGLYLCYLQIFAISGQIQYFPVMLVLMVMAYVHAHWLQQKWQALAGGMSVGDIDDWILKNGRHEPVPWEGIR